MPSSNEAAKLKVFISYSRRDCSAFADGLGDGLALIGFHPFIDRHDISAGEDWEGRLAGLIQSADTVVFVLSPEAVHSERCAWEAEKAVALSKRIIPVVALPVPDADIPQTLQRLNYIAFTDPNGFARSLGQLGEALRTDLEWIREHTRIGELAVRWHHRNQLEALLLRGGELDAAQAWLAAWKTGAPEATDVQRGFIAASAKAETMRESAQRQQLERMAEAQAQRAVALADRESAVRKLSRRTAAGLVASGVLTLCAAALAWWAVQAEERFRQQRARAEEAEKNSIDEVIRKEAMRTDLAGQVVANSTSPGFRAADGAVGAGSPYTNTLLAELRQANTSLMLALSRANTKVVSEAKALQIDQRPYLASDLNADLYLTRQPVSRKKLAVLVAVDEEHNTPKLDAPKRDVAAWEAFLSKNGFTNKVLVNPTRAELLDAIAQAKKSLAAASGPAGNSLLVMVYSGMGGAVDNVDYIAVKDTKVESKDDFKEFKSSSPNVGQLRTLMREAAAASVLIVDADFQDLRVVFAPQPPTANAAPAPVPATPSSNQR